MVKISIITTSFNAAATIRDCLESVRGQTCNSSVEHIVVDATSTDGTLAILEEYEESLARVVSEPDKGVYDGMNKGLQLATGDIVGILNADDLYYSPDVLEKVARLFNEKDVESCYGDLVYVSGSKGEAKKKTVRGPRFAMQGSPLRSSEAGQCRAGGKGESELMTERFKVVRYWRSGEFDPRKFYWGWMPPHPAFFVRRGVYERYGYFNLEMGTAADYELMLRFLVKHRISTAYMPEILIKMRSGGVSNVTIQARLRANRMDRKAWEVNGLKPYPWTLVMKPLRKVGQWVSRPEVLK